MAGVPGSGGVRPPKQQVPLRTGILWTMRDALMGRAPPTHRMDLEVVVAPAVDEGSSADEVGRPENELEVLIEGLSPYNFNIEDGKLKPHLSPYNFNIEDGKLKPHLSRDVFVTEHSHSLRRMPVGRSTRKPPASFFWETDEPKGFWSTLQSQWYGWQRKYYQGKDIIECYGKGPGLFKDIGREAKDLIFHDFLTRALRGNATSSNELSCCIGRELFDQQSLKKLLFKAKFRNTSLDLNATRFVHDDGAALESTVASKVIFHNILGPKSKALLYIPYPYVHEKLELRSLHRFAGFSGHISSGAPNAQFSCLFGTYLAAVGGLIQFNQETQVVDYSIGAAARTNTFSFGLVTSNKGGVRSIEANFYKTFENKVSSVGVSAIYIFQEQGSSVVFCASHRFPYSVTVKGRLSSSGLASLVVKKSFGAKFSLILSSDLDLGHVQQGPKLGLLFSIP